MPSVNTDPGPGEVMRIVGTMVNRPDRQAANLPECG
jgi:hypothetical protein